LFFDKLRSFAEGIPRSLRSGSGGGMLAARAASLPRDSGQNTPFADGGINQPSILPARHLVAPWPLAKAEPNQT
jgi:hypothetical protein